MGDWDDFRQIMLDRAVKLSQGIDRNGEVCRWLVDCREAILTPEGSVLVSRLLYEKLKTFKSRVVGGPQIAAQALVPQLLVMAELESRHLQGFIVRKEAKYNGLQKLVEGSLKPGDSVVLIDDLTNSGHSLLHALSAVRAAGAKAEGAVVIVNFDNFGRKKLQGLGLRVEWLYDLKDLWLMNRTGYSDIARIEEPDIVWEREFIGTPRAQMRGEEAVFADSVKIAGEGWSLEAAEPVFALREKILYAGTMHGYALAYDLSRKRILWKKKRGDCVRVPPVAAGDVVFAADYAKSGVMFAADEKGGVKWHLLLAPVNAMCLHKGRIVAGTQDGLVLVDSGKLLFESKIGSVRGVAVSDNIYATTAEGVLYSLDFSGRVLWQRKLDLSTCSRPVMHKDRIYCTSTTGRLFCFSREGNMLWYYRTYGKVLSDPAAKADYIYCGGQDGRVYVLGLDGTLQRKVDVTEPIFSIAAGRHIVVCMKDRAVAIR